MTDDFEQRARAASGRVNDEASALAQSKRVDVSADPGVSRRRSGWLAVAAVTLVVAGGASLMLVVSARDASAPTGTPLSTWNSPSTTHIVVASTVPSVSTTEASSVPPTTSPNQSFPTEVPLVAFEEGSCDSQSIGWAVPNDVNPWYAFARGREVGVPIQVIADGSAGAAGPFAVVLRYFEPTRPASVGTPTDINGNQVHISVVDPLDASISVGNGQAEWDLPDGSQGYLRSRGLDRADIESIVASLTPRASDQPVPGFDYDVARTQPERLTLLAEGTNDDVFGSLYALQCVAHTDAGAVITRVVVVADEGVAPYAAAIDRHRPAWIIRDDEAVYIGGIERPVGADLPADALTTITSQQWQVLWSPNNDTAANPGLTPGQLWPLRIGAVGQPYDDTTEIELTRSDDTQLTLDFTRTALDPHAATIELRVDGDLLASTSTPAGVLEVDAGTNARVTIDIRILNADGAILQQSGPTSLPPLFP